MSSFSSKQINYTVYESESTFSVKKESQKNERKDKKKGYALCENTKPKYFLTSSLFPLILCTSQKKVFLHSQRFTLLGNRKEIFKYIKNCTK